MSTSHERYNGYKILDRSQILDLYCNLIVAFTYMYHIADLWNLIHRLCGIPYFKLAYCLAEVAGAVLEIRAGIFKESMGVRNRVGIGLSYRPARLHWLAELIPWNRFLGSLKVYKFGLWRLVI